MIIPIEAESEKKSQIVQGQIPNLHNPPRVDGIGAGQRSYL